MSDRRIQPDRRVLQVQGYSYYGLDRRVADRRRTTCSHKLQLTPIQAWPDQGDIPHTLKPVREMLSAYELARFLNDLVDRGYVRVTLDIALPVDGLE